MLHDLQLPTLYSHSHRKLCLLGSAINGTHRTKRQQQQWQPHMRSIGIRCCVLSGVRKAPKESGNMLNAKQPRTCCLPNYEQHFAYVCDMTDLPAPLQPPERQQQLSSPTPICNSSNTRI
jgi:hypothetical protein